MPMNSTIAPILCLILSFLLTYLLFTAIMSRQRSSSPLPPGPKGWPIIGNILQITGKAPHRSLANLSKVYGPVMSLKLGSVTTVVISSPEGAKEVLKTLDNDFSARTFSDIVGAINQNDGPSAWLTTTSSHWRLWRKIMATHLFSPKSLKAANFVRLSKSKELIKWICDMAEQGESSNINYGCFVTSLNVLSNAVFSADLGSYYPKESMELQDSLRRVIKLMEKPSFVNYFPFIESLDPLSMSKLRKMYSEKLFGVFQGLIDARIVERSTRVGPSDAPSNDLLDSLISLVQEDGSEVDMNDVKNFLYDLFIAGTETNATTVEWAMAELFRNPDVMANAKIEINFIIGPNGVVREWNLVEFPYLQAIVTETLRLHPPKPILVPRKAESEIEILGFQIPKNAQILVNAWAIGRDPNVWENAERFEPERFLGRDIESIGREFEMMPFGGGPRVCPGISLALRIVPLMLASLIYSFEWRYDYGKNGVIPEELEDMDETLGVTLHKTNQIYSDYAVKAHKYFK